MIERIGWWSLAAFCVGLLLYASVWILPAVPLLGPYLAVAISPFDLAFGDISHLGFLDFIGGYTIVHETGACLLSFAVGLLTTLPLPFLGRRWLSLVFAGLIFTLIYFVCLVWVVCSMDGTGTICD